MGIEQLNNNSSIDIGMFKGNQNISQEEQDTIISIFNEIDNSKADENKTSGIISGQSAILKFYTDLKAKFGEQYNNLLKKLGLSDFNDNKEEQSYTDKMKQEFSIISDATYFGHRNEEVSKYAGQLRKNGENVVIIKMQDGTYTTIRQTTKNNTELKNYKNLEELKNDMANENYGWGRNSWGNIPFSMRDVSFIKNPLIEVVGHRN